MSDKPENPRIVSFSDMQSFLTDFWAGKYQNQRLGQAFCNAFKIDNDQHLFYAPFGAALEWIYTVYVVLPPAYKEVVQ